MKQTVTLLEELRDYSGCDSVGIMLTDTSTVFMFVFQNLGILARVEVEIERIYSTKETESEIETLLLEEIHRKISDFKRDKGILD